MLTEGKDEARLLRSVQPNDVQNEDEDADDTPREEYDQGAVRVDYFSLPSSSPMAEIAWSESDDSDELLSPSEITSNCAHLQLPILSVPIHGTHTRGVSKSHEHAQDALSFLPHPLLPAVERKHNVSQHDREKKDRAHTFGDGEDNHTPLARSRRPRRVSSFTAEVPPDSGCLGGF